MIILNIVRTKRRSSYSLRSKEGQSIEVSVPKSMSNDQIVDLLVKHRRFIKARTVKHIKHPGCLRETFSTGALVNIFGKPYTLILSQKRAKAQVDKQTLTINSKSTEISIDTLKNKLAPILLTKILAEITRFQNLPRDRQVKQVRLKRVRSLWGSCSRNGNLSFNKSLVFYPEECITYVVVHELLHLKYLNHSKAFWNAVEDVLPDFKKARVILKSKTFGS